MSAYETKTVRVQKQNPSASGRARTRPDAYRGLICTQLFIIDFLSYRDFIYKLSCVLFYWSLSSWYITYYVNKLWTSNYLKGYVCFCVLIRVSFSLSWTISFINMFFFFNIGCSILSSKKKLDMWSKTAKCVTNFVTSRIERK